MSETAPPAAPASSNQPKSLEQILNEQIEVSSEEYKRTPRALFLSALTAGLDLGFSLVAMGVLYTYLKPLVPESLIFALAALGYPVGFLFVVLGRSALFTEHTTLAILPVLAGRQSLSNMGRLWGTIYAGNILGGLVMGGRIVIVVLITFVIGLGGFHHCIVGSTELFAAVLVAEDLGAGDYLFTQGMATLGNIIGGVFFVGVLRFQISRS